MGNRRERACILPMPRVNIVASQRSAHWPSATHRWEGTLDGTSVTTARLTTPAALKAAVIPIAVLLLSGVAVGQPPFQPPPSISLRVERLNGIKSTDPCMSRVRMGFNIEKYTDVTEPHTNQVRGAIRSGDMAGVSSMVECIPQGGTQDVLLAITSAGRSATLGAQAPETQNSRLLHAIVFGTPSQ
jgi:hypothetical protein